MDIDESTLLEEETNMKEALVAKHYNPELLSKLSQDKNGSSAAAEVDEEKQKLFQELFGGEEERKTDDKTPTLPLQQQQQQQKDDDLMIMEQPGSSFTKRKRLTKKSPDLSQSTKKAEKKEEEQQQQQEEMPMDQNRIYYKTSHVKTKAGLPRVKVLVYAMKRFDIGLLVGRDIQKNWNQQWNESESGAVETFFTIDPKDLSLLDEKLQPHQMPSLEKLVGDDDDDNDDDVKDDDKKASKPSIANGEKQDHSFDAPLSYVCKKVKTSDGRTRHKISVTYHHPKPAPDLSLILDGIRNIVWKNEWDEHQTSFFTCDPDDQEKCIERLSTYKYKPLPFTLQVKSVKNAKGEARSKVTIQMKDPRKTFDIRPLMKDLKIVWKDCEWLKDGSTFFTCDPQDEKECIYRLEYSDFANCGENELEMDEIKHKLSRGHLKSVKDYGVPGNLDFKAISIQDQFKIYLTCKWRYLKDDHYRKLFKYVNDFQRGHAVIAVPETEEFSKQDIRRVSVDIAVNDHLTRQRFHCIELLFDFQEKRNPDEAKRFKDMLFQVSHFTEYAVEEFSRMDGNGGHPLDPCYITQKPIRNSLAYVLRITNPKSPDGLVFFLCEQWLKIFKPALVILYHQDVLALNLSDVETLEQLDSTEAMFKELKLLKTAFLFFSKMFSDTVFAKRLLEKLDRRWIE